MLEECECGGRIVREDGDRVCEECYTIKEREMHIKNPIEEFFNNRETYSSGRVICQGGFWDSDEWGHFQ